MSKQQDWRLDDDDEGQRSVPRGELEGGLQAINEMLWASPLACRTRPCSALAAEQSKPSTAPMPLGHYCRDELCGIAATSLTTVPGCWVD